MTPITQLDAHSLYFPPIESALQQPNGLLAIGGDLSTERLLAAYRQGIFPWFSQDDPVLWWSPDPRAVLFPLELRVNNSRQKTIRRANYRVTLNHAFATVIHACAQDRQEGTWITPDIEHAYLSLHHRGAAHSLEVWQGTELVGGLYGVAQGQLFCGESMFSRQDSASTYGLTLFCQHFTAYGGKLIDCQVLNPHTASLGAHNIARSHFLHCLAQYQKNDVSPACWQPQALTGNLPKSI